MTVTAKAAVFSGVEEPNDARTMDALRAWLEVRSWMGRSFCVFHVLVKSQWSARKPH